MSISALLAGPLVSLVDSVIDKIAPDKVSDAEREALRIKAQAEAAKQLQASETAFFDFVIKYEGQARDMPRSIQILRGLVRPVLTFSLAGLFGYGFIEGYDAELMDLLFKLNLISLTFWYGEKLVTRTGLAQAFKGKG